MLRWRLTEKAWAEEVGDGVVKEVWVMAAALGKKEMDKEWIRVRLG